MREYDFDKFDYYQGSCLHRQKVPIYSNIKVERGGTPDLRCKAGKEGCGRPLQDVTRIRPRSRRRRAA